MTMSIPNLPVDIIAEIIMPQGFFPNNIYFPLLIYRSVFSTNQLASTGIENLLKKNGWGNAWVNEIYDYHHFHSDTQEVLVIIAGWCDVIYGGPQGKIFKITEGDVIIHPAGVSHKKVNAAEGFSCVGAYPDSNSHDMFYGKKEEHPQVDFNIKKVPVPKTDPIFGENGPLFEYWR